MYFHAMIIILYYAQIEAGFLMVGHTHDDIDQRFSCFSRYLKKHSAITMEGTFINISSYLIIMQRYVQYFKEVAFH